MCHALTAAVKGHRCADREKEAKAEKQTVEEAVTVVGVRDGY